MTSNEGIARNKRSVNSCNTECIIETKEVGTQTEERKLMQLGTRGLATISTKIMLVGLLLLALLPRASAFTELLQQSPGNFASQMLEQMARQAMKKIVTGITTSISNASKNVYRGITGGCNAIYPNLMMMTSLFCLSHCFKV